MTDIIIRPDGDTDLQRAEIYSETSLPQTILEVAGDDWEVGRVAWASSAVTVTDAPLTRGDIPWTDVVSHAGFQFTSSSLQGGTETVLPIPFIALDFLWGSANTWGGHKIVESDGVTFDWQQWDDAVAEMDAATSSDGVNGLKALTVVPHAWPKASVFSAPAYEPVAGDWKESLDAFYDGIVLRDDSDAIPFVRAANETINPSSDLGVYNNLWYDAAAQDTDWTGESLPARMWWTYSAAKGARTYPSATVFINDFYVGAGDGCCMGWGETDLPAEITIENQMDQRFYIMLSQVQEALALAEQTGTGEVAASGEILDGLRLDGVGLQSHFKAVHGICEDDIKWQMWEFSGALGLGVYLTEINTKVTDAGNLNSILAGSAEMFDFASQVTSVRLNLMLKYTAAGEGMWNFWTKFTDEGADQAMTLYDNGARTVMYDTIRDLVNNPPTPVVKRAAMTNFHASGRALMPDFVTDGDGLIMSNPAALANTNIKTGAYSEHATDGLKLPHSRYKKRVGGVLSDFDPQDRTTLVQALRKGSTDDNDTIVVYRELNSGGTELLRIEYNNTQDLYVYINGGAGTLLGRVTSGERVQITFTYDGTDFEFALSTWKSGTADNATTTTTVTATIGDVATYEFVQPKTGINPSTVTRIGFHALIDGDDGPANTTELLALSPVILGEVMSQAEITAFDPATENAAQAPDPDPDPEPDQDMTVTATGAAFTVTEVPAIPNFTVGQTGSTYTIEDV